LAAPSADQDWLGREFREDCRPLVKWCNSLATNPRMLLLFALLFAGQPVWYFVVEVTVLNVLLVYVMWRHDAVFKSLLARIPANGGPNERR
ncbi:MAG: hypothetical protein ABR526_07350, partial [Chthoniobacterales bacterium]